jgi:3-hydroxyisobutyrate dehydrogenase-like beta-hydroxyacid dehydrogenase
VPPEVVGFIGIGDMGEPMSASLVRAGYRVAAYDVDPARIEHEGLERHSSVADVCDAATQTVICLVRTLPQTLEVVGGVHRSGLTLVIMSTINPTAMASIAEELAGRGIDLLDAPVSGGVGGAKAATLSVMAGGRPEVLERVRPILTAMGRNVFHVGERPGDGQAVKLANQLMLAVNMLGVFEGLKLVDSYGLRPGQVLPVIAESTGMSWVGENWEAVRGWWEGHPSGGALDIIYKDLRSLLGDAADRQISYPIAALAFQLLREVW